MHSDTVCCEYARSTVIHCARTVLIDPRYMIMNSAEKQSMIFLCRLIGHVNLYKPHCCWVKALRPSQQFCSHVGTFSRVEPVLSNEYKVSFLRTQRRAPGEIRTRNIAIKSPAHYQLSQRCSRHCCNTADDHSYLSMIKLYWSV